VVQARKAPRFRSSLRVLPRRSIGIFAATTHAPPQSPRGKNEVQGRRACREPDEQGKQADHPGFCHCGDLWAGITDPPRQVVPHLYVCFCIAV
jgi:hypothetical protein